MEADFQRDYGLDLRDALDGMTWRRFSVLVRHLSPFGAAAQAAERIRQEGEDSERAARAFFQGMVSYPEAGEKGLTGRGGGWGDTGPGGRPPPKRGT